MIAQTPQDIRQLLVRMLELHDEGKLRRFVIAGFRQTEGRPNGEEGAGKIQVPMFHVAHEGTLENGGTVWVGQCASLCEQYQESIKQSVRYDGLGQETF